MFYLIDLTKELEVQPRFFGPKLREEIERRLRQEVRVAAPAWRRQWRRQWRRRSVPLPAPHPPHPRCLTAAQVEGTCNGKYGFVLSVLNVLDTGRGLVREGSGAAVFNLKYNCICFKPFKGQVMDVVVTSVNKVRGG